MPRKPRSCPGGFVYHVWNRSAGRLRLFTTAQDYLAFERILLEAHQRFPLRVLDWCLMPNHWHFVVYPSEDEQVTDFFRWLTHTHSMRWHTAHDAVGTGALYQSRFKTLPVQRDAHLLTLLRYVERNALRAKLVRQAGEWRWGSAYVREQGPAELKAILGNWPVDRPTDWQSWLNEPQTVGELAEIRMTMKRTSPFGGREWAEKTARRMNLEWTLKPRGRPPRRKKSCVPFSSGQE